MQAGHTAFQENKLCSEEDSIQVPKMKSMELGNIIFNTTSYLF